MGLGRMLVTAAVLRGIYNAYENHIDQFKHAYKNAKAECAKQSGPAREQCIRKTMSKFYARMAQLEDQTVKQLKRVGASDSKIRRHQIRAEYFKRLSQLVKDPAVPLKKARGMARRSIGVRIVR